MCMNLIQFQSGLSTPEFLRKHGAESRTSYAPCTACGAVVVE